MQESIKNSERNVIEMAGSYNCLRLDNRYVFQVEVYEKENDNTKFFEIGDKKYLFETVRVGQLTKLISHEGKFKDSDILNLWKINAKKYDLNPVYTEDDIEELGGKIMESEQNFVNYFPNVPDAKDVNIHIVAVITSTTAGPNWNDASSIYEWIQQFTLNRGRNRLVMSFGKNFEFCGRDDAVDTLWNGDKLLGRNGIVERFKHRNERDKENHPIPVVACGPGTGKSRFLDEIEELLMRKVDDSDNEDIRNAFNNMVVINTTYGNGSPANIEDLVIVQTGDSQVINAETSLAVRILYEYFRPKHNYGELSFSAFRSLGKKYSTISRFTLNTALQVVRTDTIKQKEINSNPLLVLVLGIDEFNKLHGVHEGACKGLVNSIGGVMLDSRDIFFIPILAGTIEGPLEEYITESRYKQLRLPLYLLNMDHAIEIGKAMGLIDEKYVKLHPYFRVSIGDIGGHVRTLEYFYDYFQREIETKDPDNKDPYKVKINHIMHRVESKISDEYGLGPYSRWLTEVLAKAVLNLSVDKEDKINFNDKLTSYRDLSSMGLINLVLANTITKKFYIHIPYSWTSILVKSSNKSEMSFWKSMFTYDEPMYWQNFENFNAQFWALRLSLFRLLGYQTINLKELLSGVKISRRFPSGKVFLPKDLEICGLRHRYPAMGKDYDEMDTDDKEMDTDDDEMDVGDDEVDTEDDKKDNKMDYKTKVSDRYYTKLDHPNPRNDNIIYINASGASYDALEFLKYYEQHSNETDTLCVALQMKKRDAISVINQNQFNDEHDKVTKAMEYTREKNWVSIFLTNAKAKSLNIKNKKNSALVTEEEFLDFYGYTYTNRAQFASANEKIYINLTHEDSLGILGFNKKQRNEIRIERENRPFIDYDDIKTRIRISDKKFRKLKRNDNIAF
ncbi:hypothetical protein Glove_110g19 [Diversispora epigaea]|uniref:Uncharacterized protein n=1 Tax=Diversispora epigaea TaxID=1348612 RepID=A0A397J887_9GLOM|nr:hypothetical protein Glove_110g19 [Diversispora epigaea]